jgi:hypothetical protein
MQDSDDEAAAAADRLVPIYNYVIDSVSDLPEGCDPHSDQKSPGSVQEHASAMPPFPRQSDLWRSDGCYLHAPLDGKLVMASANQFFGAGSVSRPTRTAMFRMEVPRADSVAVVVDDGKWQYLERLVSESLWCGEVELKRGGDASGRDGGRSKTVRVEVCAHYPRETASFRTLLEYSAEI